MPKLHPHPIIGIGIRIRTPPSTRASAFAPRHRHVHPHAHHTRRLEAWTPGASTRGTRATHWLGYTNEAHLRGLNILRLRSRSVSKTRHTSVRTTPYPSRVSASEVKAINTNADESQTQNRSQLQRDARQILIVLSVLPLTKVCCVVFHAILFKHPLRHIT
jgi:hypothetical protein